MVGFPTRMFVQQPVDENLVCAICQDVFADPTTACCNGHAFCASCIEQHEKGGNNDCPSCRETLTMSPILPLRNLILAMEVRCPQKKPISAESESCSSASTNDDDNEEEEEEEKKSSKRPRFEGGTAADACASCDWKGTLSNYLAKHKTSECQYTQVVCPLGCRKFICVTELNAHKDNECTHRVVQCNPCGKEMEQRQLQQHQILECPEANTTCEFCGQVMVRKLLGTMPDHMFDDVPDPDSLKLFRSEKKNGFCGHYKTCQKVKVKCELFDLGCYALIRREDLDRHYDRHARKHAKMIAKGMKTIREAKHWTDCELRWKIPADLLRDPSSSRGTFVTKSRSVKVGVYDAYLKLTATNGGSVMVNVCVEDPPRLPVSIDNFFVMDHPFFFEFPEKRKLQRGALEQGTETHSFGSKLEYYDSDSDDGSTRDTTLEDLLRLSSNGIFSLLAEFRLKGPERLVVGCDEG